MVIVKRIYKKLFFFLPSDDRHIAIDFNGTQFTYIDPIR